MAAAKKAASTKRKAQTKYKDPAKKPLTKQERIFVKAYIACKNANKAAIEAGYAPSTANSMAYLWISDDKKKPNVYAAVQKELKKLEEKLEMTAENVLKQYWNIATADRNKIVENRRVPCRYCYGTNNKYQFTQGERDKAYEDHVMNLLLKDKSFNDYPFDEKGGVGYTIHKPINPNCPECFGLGREMVIMHDTNSLPPELKSVYAGIKENRLGKEILMVNPKDGLEAIARHLGLFNDSMKLKGDEKHPIRMLLEQMSSTLRPNENDD